MNNRFVKFTNRSLFFIIFGIFINDAQACYYTVGYSPSAPTELIIDLGDVTTQVDAATGVLMSKEGLMSSFGGPPAGFSCGSSAATGPVTTTIFISGSNDQIPEAIYETNIPGIGLKIYYYSMQATAWASEPLSPSQAATTVSVTLPTPYYSRYQNTSAAIRVELVKTGTVQKLNGDELLFIKNSFMWADSGAPVNLVNLTIKARVTSNTCNVSSSSPSQVDLGSAGTDDFSVLGSTASNSQFSIILQCTGYTNVNLTVDGGYESNEVIGEGVLKIKEGEGMAKGIGVQLLKNSLPIKFNEDLPVGSSVNGIFNIPLEARFYKTSASPVKPGIITSQMMYTLSYR